MQNPVKRLWYIKCYVPVAPDLLKAQAILSDSTVTGSAVDQEDLKPYLEKTSEKRSHFLRWSTGLLIFQDYTN